jgi:hypothetical protein
VRASALDSGNSLAIPPKNPWHALCAFRLGSGSEPFSSFVVRLFYQIRTCFQNGNVGNDNIGKCERSTPAVI